MTLVLVTPPTSEPVTLDEARAQCRVTTHDEDALIAGAIMRAREYAETYTERTLMPSTYDLSFDAWPSIRRNGEDITGFWLPRPPLISVDSVKYLDTAGQLQTLNANQYRVCGAGQRQGSGFVVPAYNVTWPDVYDVPDAITVRFTAGYDGLSPATVVPHAIRLALLMLVEHYWSHRGVLLTGTIGMPLPHGVADLLFPWRELH